MPPKNHSKKESRRRVKFHRDEVGDLFADIPYDATEPELRVTFKRNWYSPPYTEEGQVDLERAARELTVELTGGTVVVARYLANGDLGYSTEIPVESKQDLELLLRTIRKLFVQGIEYDNSVRQAALEACRTKLAEAEAESSESSSTFTERRKETDRRRRKRRGRRLLGMLWFRNEDRRVEDDRRSGRERRAA